MYQQIAHDFRDCGYHLGSPGCCLYGQEKIEIMNLYRPEEFSERMGRKAESMIWVHFVLRTLRKALFP